MTSRLEPVTFDRLAQIGSDVEIEVRISVSGATEQEARERCRAAVALVCEALRRSVER